MSDTTEQPQDPAQSIDPVDPGTQSGTTEQPNQGQPTVPGTNEPPLWAKSRIDTLTRRLREAEEAREAERIEKEELRRSLAAAQAGTGQGADPALVREEAARIAAQQQFDSRCMEVANAGKAIYKDFDDQLKNFGKLGGLPVMTVQAIIELDDPHKVIYELSKDLDMTNRIMGMAPVKQAMALAKFAAGLTKEAEEAKAPAKRPATSQGEPLEPITDTVNGRGHANVVRLDDEKTSVKDWMRERERQLAAKRKA